MSCRRVVIEGVGGPNTLRIDVRARPEPGVGEVRVRVLAAGVAAADAQMRAGRYPGRAPAMPFVPGWDVTGVVEALGADVPERWLGVRVVALVLAGGHSSHVCLPAAQLVALPDGVDTHEAACLPMNYLTAAELLRVGDVRAGESVLVHGAAGGVGTALLDLAADRKVDAIGTASAGDQEWITSFGARFLDRADTIPRVDAVFDPLGGASLARSFAALRPGGRLVCYGFLGAARRSSVLLSLLRMHWWSLLPTGRGTAFYRLSAADPRRLHQVLGTLVDALADGRLRPRVGPRLPLHDAAEAHQLIERGGVRGKILLLP